MDVSNSDRIKLELDEEIVRAEQDLKNKKESFIIKCEALISNLTASIKIIDNNQNEMLNSCGVCQYTAIDIDIAAGVLEQTRRHITILRSIRGDFL